MLTKVSKFIQKYTISILLFEIFMFFTFTYLVMNEISPINKYDENAYLMHVRSILSADNYWYLGDRNRMPLFNYYLSFFYNTNLTELENYYNLKTANLLLTCLLALLFFLKLNKRFQNKFLFINLSFFILIIPTFALVHQLLVESIFFIGFSLLLIYFEQFFKNPTTKNSIKLGLTAAIVYFLKYTGLTVFFGISLFTIIFGFIFYKRNYLKKFFTVLFTFLVIVSPYLFENYQKFDKHIFYNVNSEFYIWADSWDEIVEGVRANNDRVGWPTMEESELPSFSKYVSEHTLSDVFNRFIFGFKSIGIDYFSLNKLGSHVSIVSISAIILIIYFAIRDKTFHLLKPDYLDIITILTVGFILFSSAFMSYISTGLRYTLPITIPIFLIVFLKLDKVSSINSSKKFGTIFIFFIVIDLLILINSNINLLP